MRIRIFKHRRILGPFQSSEIEEYLGDGRLEPRDWAWTMGLEDWIPLEDLLRETHPKVTGKPPDEGELKETIEKVERLMENGREAHAIDLVRGLNDEALYEAFFEDCVILDHRPIAPDPLTISFIFELLDTCPPETGKDLMLQVESITRVELMQRNLIGIPPLGVFSKLTSLSLYRNSISDLTPLAPLTKLGKLDLGENKIFDLSPLANLTNLTELYARSNEIADISPLADLTNLMTLWLGQNEISDLSPLASMDNLLDLNLAKNKIHDLYPLTNLINLVKLDLGENPISDKEVAMLRKALPSCLINVR